MHKWFDPGFEQKLNLLLAVQKDKESVALVYGQDGAPHFFEFFTQAHYMKEIMNSDDKALEMLRHLIRDRYFMEYLLALCFGDESVYVISCHFEYEGKTYSFDYLDAAIAGEGVETGTYGEEFGMMSDFDYYDNFVTISPQDKAWRLNHSGIYNQ
jgi:hypothetical protein